MSKSKINFDQKTKLSSLGTQQEKISIVKSGEIARVKSFRFRAIDLERLTRILNTANTSCDTKRFSETDVIRLLLVIGENLPGEKLVLNLRKSVV